MDAIVPAAGEGTRLRPLTEDRPKPMVELAGRPLVEHVLDALAPAEPDRYVVVVGYRGDAIREHLGETYRDAPVEFVRQAERRGLAHAILQAAEARDGEVDRAALVCNGDNVLERDLAYLWDAHRDAESTPPTQSGDSSNARGATGANPPAATMLVQEVPEERAREVGVVETDEEGAVERVVEKPDDPPSRLVSAGAFAVEPAFFEACRAVEPAHTGEYEVANALTWLVERGRRVETCRLRGDRVNVNEPADLERAAAIVDSASSVE